MERRLRPALALSVWTFFVWTTRIRNIWTDDSLSTADQVGRTALALAFTAFAAATVVVWLRARRQATPSGAGALVGAFAVFTTGVWLVRGVQIALADHEAAFVAVHTVLAIASIALAVWAARSAHTADRDRQPVAA